MTEEGTVTHEDLDAAAEQQTPAEELMDEVTETPEVEESQEEVQPEEVPEEPTDNRERSQLGRRVKSMEEKFDQFMERTGALLQASLQKPEEKSPEPEIDPNFIPTNVAELNKWYETKEREKARRQEIYQSSYRSQLDVLGKDAESPEEHDAVVQEMMKNFNIKRSDNGVNDASINYLQAKVSYLRNKVVTPKNPLEKNKDKENKNLGGPAGTPSIKVKTPQPVKLDKYAADFVARVKMDDEKVQEALSGPTPTYLGGKV